MTQRNGALLLGAVVLGAIAAAAYALTRKQDMTPQAPAENAPIAPATDSATTPPPPVTRAITPEEGVTRAITPEEGARTINQDYGRLQSQGRTLDRLPAGYSVDGRTTGGAMFSGITSGTISEVRDANNPSGFLDLFLGVQGVARDAQGLSAKDRQEIENYRAAINRGERVIIDNKLRAFV